MNSLELTVTPESIATAGMISYWRLSGPVSLTELSKAWIALHLDPKLLPKPPGDDVALGRAVRDQASKRRLVRPLERRGAWAIVDETVVPAQLSAGEEQLEYKTVLRVLSTSQGPELHGAAVLGDAILAAYDAHRSSLEPEDISAWLIKIAAQTNAVTLRDTGGIYFVPRAAVPFWRLVVQALESVSAHRVFKIPAMRNSEAIEAITEAVTAEAQKLVATMEEELSQTGEDKLGAKALATRAAACQELLYKVQSYEQLLGVQMKVVARVEGLQGSIAAAALLSDSAAA